MIAPEGHIRRDRRKDKTLSLREENTSSDWRSIASTHGNDIVPEFTELCPHATPPPDTKARTSSASPIPKCQEQCIATVAQISFESLYGYKINLDWEFQEWILQESREKSQKSGNNGLKERLKAVKARLNFEETSQHSESGTMGRRRDLKKRLGLRHARSMSGSPEPRHGHSESPRKRDLKRKKVFKRLEKGVFHRLGDKGKSMSAYPNDSRRRSYHNSRRATETATGALAQEKQSLLPKRYDKRASSRRTEALSESESSAGGHSKSKPKRQNSSVEDDLNGYCKNHEKRAKNREITDSRTERVRKSREKVKPCPRLSHLLTQRKSTLAIRVKMDFDPRDGIYGMESKNDQMAVIKD
nr:hypothetical protein [Tanacetum cinerariifolium]